MKANRGLVRARRLATGASVVSILMAFWAEREARAGCNDGACGRIDWTEVTDDDQGSPAAAKLHGAYAWEASPDSWATHPIAGTISGYFWLTCRPASGIADPTCKQALATEIAKAGTMTTIGINGTYFVDGGAIQPPGLYAEGQTGFPALYGAGAQVGGSPMNPGVCPAALALPRNTPDGGATGGAGTGGTAGTGGSTDDAGGGGAGAGDGGGGASATGGGGASATGSAGADVPAAPAADDGGCAVAHGRASGGARVAGFALLFAALLERSRKRRPRG
jgi:MYXO-CTERM domain-containing protein